MDAQAHLLSLGWAGPGHALDARPYKQKGHRGLAYDPKEVRTTGNGLIKPLLISQRPGKFGIGKKAHEPQAGNEWWLKGFEAALGNIGKPKSEESSGTATPEISSYRGKHTGLYGFFVKGQEIEGTIGRSGLQRSKKRKSDAVEDTASEKSSSALEDARNSTSVKQFEQASQFFNERDRYKEQRPRSKKDCAIEDFQQVNEFFEASKPTKKLEKITKQPRMAETEPEPPEDSSDRSELKREEKKQRRKRRKERKARKATRVSDNILNLLASKKEDVL